MKYPYLVAGTLPDLVSIDPVRTWSRRQHRKQAANGRWYWRAGFVPYTI